MDNQYAPPPGAMPEGTFGTVEVGHGFRWEDLYRATGRHTFEKRAPKGYSIEVTGSGDVVKQPWSQNRINWFHLTQVLWRRYHSKLYTRRLIHPYGKDPTATHFVGPACPHGHLVPGRQASIRAYYRHLCLMCRLEYPPGD